MVVDDTPHVLRMLSTMLTLDGFDVVAEAESGAAAIEMAGSVDPTVVVMDYRMPQLDGLQTARALKEARPGLVIILYTAFIDGDLEREAAASGVALCVGKVEGIGSLEREISRLCATLA